LQGKKMQRTVFLQFKHLSSSLSDKATDAPSP
jgi:hypothetical protein